MSVLRDCRSEIRGPAQGAPKSISGRVGKDRHRRKDGTKRKGPAKRSTKGHYEEGEGADCEQTISGEHHGGGPRLSMQLEAAEAGREEHDHCEQEDCHARSRSGAPPPSRKPARRDQQEGTQDTRRDLQTS